ncbi:MAG TPA: M3 family metallopeptidase [Pirellulaceae bacterium]|nr:M3 family metallopeptidase [Pirellulaceae bacterium]HMO90605.1 M3 family metallopeptidase [Pirellulaceae bacterium]HMP67816.1 M3 family metallopeptidase [Pirellulaceae bacterium]
MTKFFFVIPLSFGLIAMTLTSLPHMHAQTIELDRDNPFSVPSTLPFQAPDFTKIKNEHFQPAIDAGIKQQYEEVLEVANNPDPPSFENTIVAMEKTGELLTRVSRVFFNLTSANTNPELQRIQIEMAPKLAAHSDNIFLNPQLFSRVKQLYDDRENLELNGEQHQLLKETYIRFVRAGAQLNAEEQARVRAINEEMSSISAKFQENLLALTKERSVLVDDVKELDGMSEAEIAAAAKLAADRGDDGKYLVVITNTTRQPITVSLKSRDLRKRVWEASAYRGLGRNGGIDNRELVLQLARLRAEKAALLGYASHAHYALEPQMAKTPQAASEMLTNMVPAVVDKAKQEAAEIKAMMKADGLDGDVQPWDWEYYAERVRKAKYDVDASQVKPYLELDSVLKNGVFYTMNRLFGVSFSERFDIPVYHPDVRVFDVFNEDGSTVGLFYADYFARPEKRGGAWMSSFVTQSRLQGTKPVIINVMNIPKPAEGAPALLTFDEASTMFHEMGHGVHGLFSDVEYPSLAGTSVPRDFVEFPSTFQEDWSIEPEVLQNYAKHYQTGEVLPNELLQRVLQANKFNQGFDTLEYISAALLDLDWHAVSPENAPTDMEDFEAASLRRHGVDLPAVPPRYKTAYFAHVWPGGYAASYYAYMWSEVLAADSFALVQGRGGLSRESGEQFRNSILSRGGSSEPMDLYIEFAGREPSVDGLLIRRGLKEE